MQSAVQALKDAVQFKIVSANAARVLHWSSQKEVARRLSETVIVANTALLEKGDAATIAKAILQHLNVDVPVSAPKSAPRKSQKKERMQRKQEEPSVTVSDLMRQYIEHEQAMIGIQQQIVVALGGEIPEAEEEVEQEVEVRRKNKPRRQFNCSKCGAPKPGAATKCKSCNGRAPEPVTDPEFEEEA
jgi:hypothetical protein